MNAATELRAAVIAFLKADAGVQASALGSSPRIVNFAPDKGTAPDLTFPFLVVKTGRAPWDTTTEWGSAVELTIHVLGEFEGDEEGEAIFAACYLALRDYAPQSFSTNRLINLVLASEGVSALQGEGAAYAGAQVWTAKLQEN